MRNPYVISFDKGVIFDSSVKITYEAVHTSTASYIFDNIIKK